MTIRMFATAALAAVWCTLPAPAPPPVAKSAPTDRPAVSFQVQSVNHILEDIRGGIKYTAGPLAEHALGQFNEAITKFHGTEGFDGIDPAKPAGGYVNFADTPEET